MKKMTGVVVAMTTPFTEDGSLDLKTLEESTNFLLDKGITCLYPCGTTGEMHLMSKDERKAAAEIVVKHSKDRASVFVQCGAMTKQDTQDLMIHAKKIGADGAGVVTPSFFGLSETELRMYYQEIAACAGDDFPVYLYNIPQCSGNDISLEVCEELADTCGNIAGIKYSWNNPDRISDYLSVRNYQFSVLVGLERHFLPYLALGCDGVVSGCANAFPEIFLALYQAYLKGDGEEALVCQRKIDALVKCLTADKSIARVKAAQSLRGIGNGCMRQPLQKLDGEGLKAFKKEISSFL